jgi:O-antigen/teichoic acid export membrane protein
LQNLPVLLISAIVIDRVAVAQWGLTRVTAGLVRAVCVQATLPLAAELGHDRAIGAKVALRRLYARGSVFVTGLASLVVSAFLAFWPDFFGLWTRGAVPYDAVLTLTLLIGALLVSPSMLALGFAYYSDRGELLARTKGLQLVVFLVLALVLTTRLGALGAAIAVVASDLLVQFGLLALPLMRETLERPLRHLLFLALVMALVTTAGWALGLALRFSLPGTGLGRFAGECVLWLVIVGLAAGPLASKRLRERLMELVPA